MILFSDILNNDYWLLFYYNNSNNNYNNNNNNNNNKKKKNVKNKLEQKNREEQEEGAEGYDIIKKGAKGIRIRHWLFEKYCYNKNAAVFHKTNRSKSWQRAKFTKLQMLKFKHKLISKLTWFILPVTSFKMEYKRASSLPQSMIPSYWFSQVSDLDCNY